MSNQFSFLSWVQNPLVGRSEVHADSLRPVVPVQLNLQVGGGYPATDTVTKDLAIRGPGDVIGLQPEAVLKTTPPAGEQQYSPLLLPSIEFSEEDLPWRYSPQQALLPSGQKAPWCFLLTLKEEEFTALPQGSGPLPAIQVKNLSVFPDPAQTWLWGHVQVNQALTTSPTVLVTNAQSQAFVDGALKQNPDLAFSRLLSPRKLDANATYHAFLVPAYETGRLAGLGQPFSPVPTATLTALTSSWSGTGSKAFPVYYQWQFRTGDDGDFESLARRMQAQQLENFGNQPLAAYTPLGSLRSAASVEQQLVLPGIVHAVVSAASTPDPTQVVTDLRDEVNKAFVPPTAGTGTYVRPVVAPPAYGRAYATPPAAGLDAASTDWFSVLNLHPGYRALAAVGGNVIQDNQEEYMQRAWEQVRDIIAANANLRGMQSGLQTTTSLRTQHLPLFGTGLAGSANRSAAPEEGVSERALSPASELETKEAQNRTAQDGAAPAPEAVLPPDEGAGQDEAIQIIGGGQTGATVDLENYGLHLTGLAFTRLLNPLTGLTLQETVRQSRVPLAAFTPAFRRITKPFGRYQAAQAGRPLRPTQGTPAGTPTTLLEPGRSLRQRDSLLALLATYDPGNPQSAGITGARPKDRVVRNYQFVDRVLDDLLHGDHSPLGSFQFFDGNSYFSTTVGGAPGTPGGNFAAAFASFGQVRFETADPVKPALNLGLLKQVVIQGTRPGPVYLARANRALRLLPHYGSYGPESGEMSAPSAPNPGTTPSAPTAPVAAARGTTVATAGTTANATANTAAPTLQQVQPIMAYPVFKEPMSEQLRRRHPELFIPNLGDFPANVVTLLEYNHAFIEAYMVGLNHAFGSELLWREYPTDLRGSYFRQFWDVSEKLATTATNQLSAADLAAAEEANRDITPIASWGSHKLGENYPAQNRPQLTLAVRADLLRRFPTTVICAVPGKMSGNDVVPDFTGVTRPILYPAQRTTLGQDILLLNFDLTSADALANLGYFFVFHERPGEPQFGLDDGPAGTTQTSPIPRWSALTWQHLGYLLPNAPTGGVNLPAGLQSADAAFATIDSSAKLAYALFQKPFMVAIHATQMGFQ